MFYGCCWCGYFLVVSSRRRQFVFCYQNTIWQGLSTLFSTRDCVWRTEKWNQGKCERNTWMSFIPTSFDSIAERMYFWNTISSHDILFSFDQKIWKPNKQSIRIFSSVSRIPMNRQRMDERMNEWIITMFCVYYINNAIWSAKNAHLNFGLVVIIKRVSIQFQFKVGEWRNHRNDARKQPIAPHRV